MSQPVLNIGTIGHVDHGKTTLTKSISGKWTDTHSEELKRGITIKLGYADFTIFKGPGAQGPAAYGTKATNEKWTGPGVAQRTISLVDAPGHETLMATVIAASSILDGALFVIAANEKCPQPQTIEHLMVLEAAGIKNVIIVQNKVDLVTKEGAKAHAQQIRDFIKGSSIEKAPIVPTSANFNANIDALLWAIETTIPTPKRDETKTPILYVARSFDVNKPGADIPKLKGGVIGGSLVQGVLKKGMDIDIFPGFARTKKEKEYYQPIRTTVTTLLAGGDTVDEVRPGGLVGIATTLDPALTKGDGLGGQLVAPTGTLPQPVTEFVIELQPLARQLEKFPETFAINEPLILGIGTIATLGFVSAVEKNKGLKLLLKKPIVPLKDAKIAVMRRIGGRWHLYGVGKIRA